eukprot:53457_1
MDDKTRNLTVYLNDTLVQLNADQRQHIMKIIATEHTSPICIDTDKTKEDRIQTEYILDTNDTFLHQMLGDTKADKIQRVIDHQLVLIALVLLRFSWMILNRSLCSLGYYHFMLQMYRLTDDCIFIVWFVFKHLLFNKVAFKLCLHTFEFWIKVGYGVMLGIASAFHGSPPVNGFDYTHVGDCSTLVAVVIGISYISSNDAVYCTKKKKLVACIVAALVFSAWSTTTHFFVPEERDYKIMIQLSNGVNVISMQSLMARSSQIIAMFMWKQTYKTWHSNGRAVIISMTPKIAWNEPTSLEQKLAEVITPKNKMDSVITANTTVSEIDIKCCKHQHHDEAGETSESESDPEEVM